MVSSYLYTKLEILINKKKHLFSAVKKLENSLFKFYVIHALTNNRTDKVNEFLTKMTNDLQMQNDWKDWFSKIKIIFKTKL